MVREGKLVTKSPTFITMASSRKAVLPSTKTQAARPMAIRTLICESRRMPLSTPVVAEMVAMITAKAMSPICAALPSGMPNSRFRPKLSWTTPMPRLVATPKMVPSTAAVSTVWPKAPSMRLPKIGYNAERTARGRLRR